MFPVIFQFSLLFPSQSSIILFPSTLLSIPFSFKFLPFQLSLHLQSFIPTSPTPTCSLTFIDSNSSSASFPLIFALFSHSTHSSPVSFTLLLLLYFCALASSFFLYLPFPFTYFFLHPILSLIFIFSFQYASFPCICHLKCPFTHFLASTFFSISLFITLVDPVSVCQHLSH